MGYITLMPDSPLIWNFIEGTLLVIIPIMAIVSFGYWKFRKSVVFPLILILTGIAYYTMIATSTLDTVQLSTPELYFPTLFIVND